MTGYARKVELNLDGTWTDISSYVREKSAVTITRGRRDEQSAGEPGTCRFTLDNRDGRFSPRNPTGPYYGLIGRNTQVRVSVLPTGVRMVRPDGSVLGASCPDSVATSITGDIDIRVDVSLPSWTGQLGSGIRLVQKDGGTGQASYRFNVNTNCGLSLLWSADGTNFIESASTCALPWSTGRIAVRATLDVNNGAAGNTVTFYYSDTMSGTWTQLGAAVVTAGTTSIFNSTAATQTGFVNSANTYAEYYAIKVLEGIGGTERVNPDFTAQAEGATSFADAAGNTWTLAGSTCTARRYRFYGEVSDWPVAWDASGGDVTVEITANGVLRRIGQGSQTTIPAIKQAVLGSATAAVGYWPMEDEAGASSLASGLTDGQAMSVTGTTALADDTPFRAAGAIPRFNSCIFTGSVTPYTFGTINQVGFLVAVPSSGETDDQILMSFNCAGTASQWRLVMDTSGAGGLTLQAYNSAGTQLFSSGAGFPTVGKFLYVFVKTTQNGANIDWLITTRATTTGDGLVWSGTLNSNTIGAISTVTLNPSGTLTASHVGHLMVHGAAFTDTDEGVLGYINESASVRVRRAAELEGLDAFHIGDRDDATLMGTQYPMTFVNNMIDCETSDAGMLLESRTASGLAYRARRSMCMQRPRATLDYTDLSAMVPTDDDQFTRNDVTADRPGGSSARRTLTTGPLSKLDPPDGVGSYATTYPVNTNVDTYLRDHANWRLTQGTMDRPRYPVLGVQIGSPEIGRTSTLATSLIDADCGDVLLIENLPAWLPPDDSRLLILGYTETLGFSTHDIEFTCAPADGYDTGLYDNPLDAVYGNSWESRYDNGACTLNEALDTTETGVDVITAAGNPVWTQAGGDYPFDLMIGGEVMTATGISGSGSTQTFTVTRSVNGVVKSHASGTTVELAYPDRYLL